MNPERKKKLQDFLKKEKLTKVHLDIVDLAFTHKSYANEHKLDKNILLDSHNQRLEFLGDTVLGLVIAKTLYKRLPDSNEGELTRKKAQAVCEATLAEIGSSLNLGEYLLLGKGEKTAKGHKRISIIADTLEALIGAVYLGTNIEYSEKFILRTWEPYLVGDKTAKESYDYKSRLQEWLVGKSGMIPQYQVVAAEGPEHEKTFTVALIISGETKASASASSRKKAEQEAAKEYIKLEKLLID
ncbi:MAG: ribonuclease III [Spirochaetia bacterium]|nr:ribonuclease III [Spirochaetia bacterium]